MATEEELQDEAKRYSANWAADSRFCHVFNRSHECKPTCFKKTEYKKPSTDEAPQKRIACRFRFWRLVLVARQWLRRMGKALVTEPTVAAADDADNEFGRCKVCRANCLWGATQDLCQVCLRCSVDYQYRNRTFPEEETTGQDVADGASGLAIIDISNPASPGTPVYRDTNGSGRGVVVRGNYAYLADGPAGLAIIDISNPAIPGAPVYKDTEGSALGLAVTGNYAYVGDAQTGLAIIDISNPASPGTPVYKNTDGNAFKVNVVGNYAIFAEALAFFTARDRRFGLLSGENHE